MALPRSSGRGRGRGRWRSSGQAGPPALSRSPGRGDSSVVVISDSDSSAIDLVGSDSVVADSNGESEVVVTGPAPARGRLSTPQRAARGRPVAEEEEEPAFIIDSADGSQDDSDSGRDSSQEADGPSDSDAEEAVQSPRSADDLYKMHQTCGYVWDQSRLVRLSCPRRSLLHAAHLQQHPPLPLSALAGLPFQLNRRSDGPRAGRLDCDEVTDDRLPEGVAMPPSDATSQAFDAGDVELGLLELPLSPTATPLGYLGGVRAAKKGKNGKKGRQEDACQSLDAAATSSMAELHCAVVAVQEGALREDMLQLRTTVKKGTPSRVSLSLVMSHAEAATSSLMLAMRARRGCAPESLDAAAANQTVVIDLAAIDLTNIMEEVLLQRLPWLTDGDYVDVAYRLVGPDGVVVERLGSFRKAGTNGGAGKKAAQRGRSRKGKAIVASVEAGEALLAAAGAEVVATAEAAVWRLEGVIRMQSALIAPLMAREAELAQEVGDGSVGRGCGARLNKETLAGDRVCEVANEFALLLQDLLLVGRGLWLGPDCDGLLNFCDPGGAMSLLLPDEAAALDASSFTMELFPEQPAALRVLTPSAANWLFSLRRVLLAGRLPVGYPTMHTPHGIKALPKPFQLQGLEWMLQRERRGDATGRSVLRLYPGWLQFVTREGHAFYLFYPRGKVDPMMSLSFLPAPVGGTCGGFLCDEMGLGKTLECLMLILSNPAPPSWAITSSEAECLIKERRGEEPAPIPIRTTLVIAPSNLLSQWQDEIEVHVSEPGKHLKWGEYNGDCCSDRDVPTCRVGERQVPITDLDVVFLSYELLRRELSLHSPLLRFGFWRIMLDEAQMVANTNSVAAVMASQLWRRHAWVVTGTPVSSKLDEIRGLCEFLAVDPFHYNHSWQNLLARPYQAREVGGMLAMRSLLKGVMLRRTKEEVQEQLQLPPCTRQDITVKLSPVERAFYGQMKERFQASMRRMKTLQAATDERAGKGKIAPQTMAALTALRQACCHPHVVSQKLGEDVTKREQHSMSTIMARLVGGAASELDQAVAGWLKHRLLAAAVEFARCDSGSADPAPLTSLLSELHANAAVASCQDFRWLGRARAADGSLIPDAVATATAVVQAPGVGVQDGEASERCRRHKKLELELHVLLLYCLKRRWPHAVPGGPAALRVGASGALAAPPQAAPAHKRARTSCAAASPQAAPAATAPAAVMACLTHHQEAEVALRAALGLPAASFLEAASTGVVRRSRRQEGVGVEVPGGDLGASGSQDVGLEEPGAEVDEEGAYTEGGTPGGKRKKKKKGGAIAAPKMTHEAIILRREQSVRDLLALLETRNPPATAATRVEAAAGEMRKKWHALQHLLNQEEEQTRQQAPDQAGPSQPVPHEPAAAPPGTAQGVEGARGQAADGAAAGANKETYCPICLDVAENQTLTSCGHTFCRLCIHEVVDSHGDAPCPICRTSLRRKDLFDTVSEEMARANELLRQGVGRDHGSKVSALMSELLAVEDADPGAKSLVFSTWGRLLHLISGALTLNGVGHACLFGAEPDARRAALHRFAHDPQCRVLLLLMSTSSGAAGLTLTHASHAFIMEPALAPGLEAQAAARIYRMGQRARTRVVRFLAEDTVEQRVLALQRSKAQASSHASGPRQAAGADKPPPAAEDAQAGLVLQDMDGGTLLRFFDL